MPAHVTNAFCEGKLAALKMSRSLHPQPQRVSDPLFYMSEFFDRRDGVQVKYEMLRRVQIERAAVASVAVTFGFSRVTWYQLKSRFDQHGLFGLLSSVPGPREGSKLSDHMVRLLIGHHAQHPDKSIKSLQNWLQTEHGVEVHARSVRRVLPHTTAQKKLPG